ncbi:MAG TPA: response regulator transcription factor [Lutibacter sp.]|nr:response regulator transcription factor [Lutibacter sp.]
MKTKNFTILLVDDEPDILEFLEYNFSKEGYKVKIADNGNKAIKKAIKHNPDLILLDVMMPEIDGMETCRRLRELDQFKETIIIFLTARGEDYSEIAGFEAGADDYITKPIRPRTLIARVKAILKRRKKETTVGDLSYDSIYINVEKREVLVKGEKIKLPKMEFNLLYLLALKPEKVYVREEIYSKIWGDNVVVGARTLDVHIRKLRKKIGQDYIKTSKGVGYSFVY